MAKKPKLHWSHIDMLMRCPKQYQFRYVDGIVRPPGIALHVGSSVHEAVADNMRHKADSGHLLALGDVKERAAASLRKRWDEEGVWMNEDELARGIENMRGAAVDEAVSLTAQHHREVAPHIKPISAAHVERPFVIRTKRPYDIAGTFDEVEAADIRDTKTSKQGLQRGDVDSSVQFSIYALAALLDPEIGKEKGHHAFEGEPGTVDIKVDVLNKKTGKSKTMRTQRDMKAIETALSIVDVYWKFVQTGVFPPSTNGWWCSSRWCGWHDQCPFFTGRK